METMHVVERLEDGEALFITHSKIGAEQAICDKWRAILPEGVVIQSAPAKRRIVTPGIGQREEKLEVEVRYMGEVVETLLISELEVVL
jgi:hypothetical protein